MSVLAAARMIPGATFDPMSSPDCVVVPVAQWTTTAQALKTAGATRAEWLTAVDLDNHVRVVCLIRSTDDEILLATDLSDSRIASLCEVWPGLQWHERECAEMFGLTFEGLPNPNRLLLAGLGVHAPLRRNAALSSRLERAWPGAVTASGASVDAPARGRRAIGLPPGVHPEWQAAKSTNDAGADT